MMVVCFAMLGIMELKGKKDLPKSNQQNAESVAQLETEESSTSLENDDSSGKVEISTEKPVFTTEQIREYSESETVESGTEVPNSDTEANEDMYPDVSKLTVNDLNVSTMNDYAHIKSDVIFLGNNEGVTITVKASAKGLDTDDILFIYDENLLSVKAKEPFDVDKQTCFEYYVTGNKACNTSIAIVTTYDYLTLGENTSGFILDIIKADSTDGRIVYVTPTGERYHFSEKCAGEYAIKTTYRDATAYEYQPCGKCVK